MSTQTPSRTERIGQTLAGRFRITGKLGAGGFATVYRGVQLNLDQPVAIKILDIRTEDPAIFLERFLREAKTAARLRHPDIVNIIDFGSTEHDEPYMVLELLDGVPLDVEFANNGRMEPARALRLFIRALDALDTAHRHGVIHRDLKPANLFLCSAGTMVEHLKLLDFGIAHAVGNEGERLTGTGQLLGTPAFLPPEYIENQVVTPAIDVYQMGLILVQALTGRPVVEGANIYQSIMAACTGELDIPHRLLGSPIGGVITQAVAREPDHRYQNAGEFRDALAEVDPSTIPTGDALDADRPKIRTPTVVIGDENDSSVLEAADTPPAPYTAQETASHPPPDVLKRAAVPPGPPKKKKRGGLWLMALVVAFCGAAGVVTTLVILAGANMANKSDDPEDDGRQETLDNTSAAKAPVVNNDETRPEKDDPPYESGANDPKPEPDEATDPPPAEERTVMVVTRPANANIFDGDQKVGKGTLSLSFKSDDPKRSLRVKARGYEEQVVDVEPNAGTVLVELVRTQKGDRTGKRDKTAEKGKTEPAESGNTKAEVAKTVDKTPPEKPKDKKNTGMGFIDESKKDKGKMGVFE